MGGACFRNRNAKEEATADEKDDIPLPDSNVHGERVRDTRSGYGCGCGGERRNSVTREEESKESETAATSQQNPCPSQNNVKPNKKKKESNMTKNNEQKKANDKIMQQYKELKENTRKLFSDMTASKKQEKKKKKSKAKPQKMCSPKAVSEQNVVWDSYKICNSNDTSRKQSAEENMFKCKNEIIPQIEDPQELYEPSIPSQNDFLRIKYRRKYQNSRQIVKYVKKQTVEPYKIQKRPDVIYVKKEPTLGFFEKLSSEISEELQKSAEFIAEVKPLCLLVIDYVQMTAREAINGKKILIAKIRCLDLCTNVWIDGNRTCLRGK
jgi:hypothetical protein